jgi:hypothetical protein
VITRPDPCDDRHSAPKPVGRRLVGIDQYPDGNAVSDFEKHLHCVETIHDGLINPRRPSG